MIKMSCPYCEAIHEVKEIKRTESIIFKGKNVTYDAIHYECSNCHEVFDSAQMMDDNLLAAREAYELLEDSVSPAKIISIRESYNASQKAFGLILGMGELTINSYEQGKSIPMSSNRLLLHLSENPLIFFEMYERNKNKIGAIQRERIEASEAFKQCKKWGGLENLYNNLSDNEIEIIENRTSISGSSKTHVVSDMIRKEMDKPSFEIYSGSEEIDSNKLGIKTDLGVA